MYNLRSILFANSLMSIRRAFLALSLTLHDMWSTIAIISPFEEKINNIELSQGDTIVLEGPVLRFF